MRTLLLVAHGSRVASSNDAVAELVKKLRARLAAYGFDAVSHAFLELTTPGIAEGVQDLVEGGASQIVVLPFFLAPGTHVVDDMPELIAAAEEKYSSVAFSVMPYLGGVEGIIDLILDSASKAE